MKNMKKTLLVILVFVVRISFAQTTSVKILFDARKAEMASNADWIIDSDTYNIGTGTGGIMQTGKGNEANPQRIPTPAQSGITSTTSETYWKGALSSWAVACVKKGFVVETLPYNVSLTYGNTSNPQDLSNYKIYIVDEPNIKFTTTEKTAIIQFVQNGGGLFMISDHDVSDRNNDGFDSPHIWNDLMSTNGISTNPFGITFDYQNFSQTTSNFKVSATNGVLHGAAGNPTQMKFSNGTSMTLNTTANSTATGVVYKTGSSTIGTTGVMMAHSHYGAGKVAAIGDSSPMDDGTGDTGDVLYNGWSAEVNGDHSKIMMNATIWLSDNTARISNDESTSSSTFNMWPNPTHDFTNIQFVSNTSNEIYTLQLVDLSGRILNNINGTTIEGINTTQIPLENLSKGIYLIQLQYQGNSFNKKIILY